MPNPDTSMDLFVYGTLMFPEVWMAVTGSAPSLVPGSVQGYARYRVSGQYYPALVPGGREDQVEGYVCQGLDAVVLLRLDLFEGPLYQRVQVPVHTRDMVQWCITYQFRPEHYHLLSGDFWSPEWFQTEGLSLYS